MLSSFADFQRRITFLLSAFLVLSLCLGLAWRDLGAKYIDSKARDEIVRVLKPIRYEIPDGVLRLKLSDFGTYDLDWVEANYVLYRVKKNIKTFSYISSSATYSNIPDKISNFPKRWFLFENTRNECLTDIEIKSISQSSFIKKLFFKPHFELKSIVSSCGKSRLSN
jgi:hypothetical protein